MREKRTSNYSATPDRMQLFGRALTVLLEGGLLAPESLGLQGPLDLRGIALPTVPQTKVANSPTNVVNRISERLEFTNATLRDIDLNNATISFSVWSDCTFERVDFGHTHMNHARFFGCRFFNCTFSRTGLRNASFSVGRNGLETEISATCFNHVDFRSASCSNPVLRLTRFRNCKLDGFVFDGALCEHVSFIGKYPELTFRGVPNDRDRNLLGIDLSYANITWLNADRGLNLHAVIPPLDGSCLIIKERVRAIDCICERLPREAGAHGSLVSAVLVGLFSDRALSPLDPCQDMVLISKSMISDFAETTSTEIVNSIFFCVRAIAQSEGFLV